MPTTGHEAKLEAPDAETRQILEEMTAEGIEVPSKPSSDGEPAKETPEAPKEQPADKEPEKDNAKKQESQKSKPPSKDDDEDDEDGDDDDDAAKPQVEAEKRRRPLYTRYERLEKEQAKRKEADDRVAELEAEIERLKGRPAQQSAAIDEATKAIVESFGSEEAAKPFLSAIDKIVENRMSPFTEAARKVQVVEQQNLQRLQETKFDEEFTAQVTPLIAKEYPKASTEQLRRIRRKIERLAFSDEYLKTPLSVIYKGHDDFRQTGTKTAEPSAPASPTHGKRNFSSDGLATAEEIAAMSDKEFEEYSATLAAQSKFVIRRAI